MKSRFLLFLAILIGTCYGFGFIQDDDPLKKIVASLQKFRDEYPQEKVHIHTDRPYYSIGDSIWFKAYVLNSEQNELSALSNILYVDLINEKDSIKKSLRLPVVSGLAWGDFVLADTLAEGNYRIRAYTNWMRNFGEEFFFDKTIRVGKASGNVVVSNVSYAFSKTGNNQHVEAVIGYSDIKGEPLANREVEYNVQLDARNIAKGKGTTDADGKLTVRFTNNQPFILKSGRLLTTIKLDAKTAVSKSFPVKATSDEVNVQFFPESGQLVNGIRSRVAFKALGADGLSREVSGTIVDKDNKNITEFKSEHAGMGTFGLTPEDGNVYTAVLKFGDGSEKKIALPAAVPSGYVLAVGSEDPTNISVRISASTQLLGKGAVTLVAQSNGVIKYAARNVPRANAISAVIPKHRFPTGIVQFTLFSPENEPVAERLVFVRHPDALKLDISTDKPSYGKRQKVRMIFNSSDSAGKGLPANFSVAVINESKAPVDESGETTILSNILLTSDLKGYIEKPNYYFTEPDANKLRHLDNLLLTQGWRRFTWKNIISGGFPNISFQPEKTISISGSVKTLGGKPVAGGRVTLFASKGSVMILDTITDAEGKFRFDSLGFGDSTRFVIQARNAKDKKNVEIEIDRVPPQLVTRSKNTPDVEINVNASLLPYLRTRRNEFDELTRLGLLRRNIVLEEVRIVDQTPAVKNSSNLNGAGRADAVVTADKLQSCPTLDLCLQGLLPGVVFRNRIAFSTRSLQSPMQLIVDGMYMEPDYLSMIPPNDVESVEVLRTIGNIAIYGSRGSNGVLIINTKRGGSDSYYARYVPGITTFNPQGYYIAREFYSPDYDTPKLNKELPDLRTTVFWTPNLLTDASGKASFEFFTASEAGTYKVIAEGVDGKGGLTRRILRFEVK